jgi:hypothetical protein
MDSGGEECDKYTEDWTQKCNNISVRNGNIPHYLSKYFNYCGCRNFMTLRVTEASGKVLHDFV